MKITLTRHGATQSNLEKRYIGGSTDEPLSEQGKQELRFQSPHTSVSRVFVSGLIRTRETAKILYPNAEQIMVPALREMEFGVFEGKNFEELAEVPAYRAWVDSGCETTCPGGESKELFTARCVDAFRQIIKQEQTYDRTDLFFVVHFGTIRALLSEMGDPSLKYFDIRVRPGESWVLEYEDDKLRLIERPKSA